MKIYSDVHLHFVFLYKLDRPLQWQTHLSGSDPDMAALGGRTTESSPVHTHTQMNITTRMQQESQSTSLVFLICYISYLLT